MTKEQILLAFGLANAFGFTHCGAGEGTRTLTVFPPADFESAASTSSATPA